MNKGLENLNDLIIENLICSEKSQERVRIIEKELKALEILLPIIDLEYLAGKWFILGIITQEQYDLLKEVL